MLEQFLTHHFLAQMSKTVGPLVQIRLVDLEYISGENHLRAFAGTGDDGLDLVRGEILRLIDDEESLAEASASDIGERRDHEFLVLEEAFDLQGFLGRRTELGLDDIQIVHERLQIRTHLRLLVSRKESDILIAQNDGRTGEDDLIEVTLLLESCRQREQCLAGTGSAGQ